MPIIILRLDPTNRGAPGYPIAIELARQCVDQYQLNIIPGVGGGIAAGSCWAALAVAPAGPYHNLNPVNPFGTVPNGGGVHVGPGGLGYGIVFGNSRVATVNAAVTVPGFIQGGHAERVVIYIAAALGLGLPFGGGTDAVMFVQLHPCHGDGTHNCLGWLNAIPMFAPSAPFTLHVYYRFAYPAGVAAMTAWNNQTRDAQQNDITMHW